MVRFYISSLFYGQPVLCGTQTHFRKFSWKQYTVAKYCPIFVILSTFFFYWYLSVTSYILKVSFSGLKPALPLNKEAKNGLESLTLSHFMHLEQSLCGKDFETCILWLPVSGEEATAIYNKDLVNKEGKQKDSCHIWLEISHINQFSP